MLKTKKRIYSQQPDLLSVSILMISLLVLYLIPTGPPIHAYANTFVNPKCRIFARFFHNYKQLRAKRKLILPSLGLALIFLGIHLQNSRLNHMESLLFTVIQRDEDLRGMAFMLSQIILLRDFRKSRQRG